jgi:hypothetical protein
VRYWPIHSAESSPNASTRPLIVARFKLTFKGLSPLKLHFANILGLRGSRPVNCIGTNLAIVGRSLYISSYAA